VSGSSKQVLVIDDDYDSAFTVKSCLESHYGQNTQESGSEIHAIQVTIYIDPLLALLEFKPYYYDLLIVDINMPSINGYELVEKIIELDFNIKICFMSAGEINYEAIRDIRHPSKNFGCFIKNRPPVLIWSIVCCRNCTRKSRL
jgi:CheY-like chemotaxis protein